MKQVLFEVDSSVPVLHVSIAFATGSISDPDGKEGTTRLLLRLLCRTAGGRSANECFELLDRMGATLGPEVSRSVAGLHGSVIARSRDEFLDFLRSALGEPQFTEEEVARLKREAIAELVEATDDDSSLARRFFARRFFQGHAYGRPGSGTQKSLERITLADLEAHYQTLRAQGPVIVSFAGDANPARLMPWAEELKSGLERPGAPPLPEPADPLGPGERVLLFVDKPQRTQTQILIGCLGTHPADPDHAALQLAHVIFGGTFTARLSQEIRAKRGWSYGAYSSLPIDRRRQVFSLWTFPKASDAAPCIRLELELTEQLIARGVRASELVAAKRYLRNSDVFHRDTANKRAGLVLDELTYGLPKDYHEELRQRLQKVTREEVAAAASERLSTKRSLITVVGTHAEVGSEVAQAAQADVVEVVPFDQTD